MNFVRTYAIVDEQALDTLQKLKIYFSYTGQNRFKIGDIVSFDPNVYAEPYSAIFDGYELPSIGSFSYSWSSLPADIKIGRYCSISWGLGIIGGNHPTDFISTSSFSTDSKNIIYAQPIIDNSISNFKQYPINDSRPGRESLPKIGNDVWIGQNVTLGRGITLGTGCAIAANSVVTRSVPSYAIVGGNPARLIRMRFNDDIIQKMLASNWWTYCFTDFAEMRYDKPEIFIAQLQAYKARGEIKTFSTSLKLWGEIFKNII